MKICLLEENSNPLLEFLVLASCLTLPKAQVEDSDSKVSKLGRNLIITYIG